jgi:hypothetical protein
MLADSVRKQARTVLFSSMFLAACGSPGKGKVVTTGTGSGTDGGTGGGSIGGLKIFSSDSAWNQDISGADVDPSSAAYIASMSPSAGLHPDFSNIVDGNYGIPYVIVDSSQAMEPVTFNAYGNESDPGPYPIPLGAPIENGSDQHVLAVDKSSSTLYELFTAQVDGTTGWTAACGAKFDLTKGDLQRPDGWTSADAAGLPIFPGLTRTDEVIDAGVIDHALRFTMNNTQAGYVAPASHLASSDTNPSWPPMGLRLRLKASVDISSAGPQAKVILTALKKYGMILADNGSNWFISGAPDARWDDDDLHTIGNIKGSDFEVIKHGAIGTTSP